MANEYKVNGLDIFADKFKEFSENYIIVGGTACSLLLGDAGIDFRATKDIDMIITVEEISRAFGETFWQFIKEGGYEVYQSREGVPQFFRFKNPQINAIRL